MRWIYLVTLAGVLSVLPVGIDLSFAKIPTVSMESAQAYVGRPATARRAAGVHRRVTRRATRRAIIYCTAPSVPRGCVWR